MDTFNRSGTGNAGSFAAGVPGSNAFAGPTLGFEPAIGGRLTSIERPYDGTSFSGLIQRVHCDDGNQCTSFV